MEECKITKSKIPSSLADYWYFHSEGLYSQVGKGEIHKSSPLIITPKEAENIRKNVLVI